jgi:hypothetical protein
VKVGLIRGPPLSTKVIVDDRVAGWVCQLSI